MGHVYNLGLSFAVCQGKSCAVLLPPRTVEIKQVLLETVPSERRLGTRVQRESNSSHILSNLLAVSLGGCFVSECRGVRLDWKRTNG